METFIKIYILFIPHYVKFHKMGLTIIIAYWVAILDKLGLMSVKNQLFWFTCYQAFNLCYFIVVDNPCG